MNYPFTYGYGPEQDYGFRLPDPTKLNGFGRVNTDPLQPGALAQSRLPAALQAPWSGWVGEGETDTGPGTSSQDQGIQVSQDPSQMDTSGIDTAMAIAAMIAPQIGVPVAVGRGLMGLIGLMAPDPGVAATQAAAQMDPSPDPSMDPGMTGLGIGNSVSDVSGIATGIDGNAASDSSAGVADGSTGSGPGTGNADGTAWARGGRVRRWR